MPGGEVQVSAQRLRVVAAGGDEAADQPPPAHRVTRGLAPAVVVAVEGGEERGVGLQPGDQLVPGHGRQVRHGVGRPGRVQQPVLGLQVRPLVGGLEVRDVGAGVQHRAPHPHRVQPVGGVEAVVGGDGGRHVRHVGGVAALIVEYLELVHVGVAVEL